LSLWQSAHHFRLRLFASTCTPQPWQVMTSVIARPRDLGERAARRLTLREIP
jgi:hypothetical protein